MSEDNNKDWKKFKEHHDAEEELFDEDQQEEALTEPMGELEHPDYQELQQQLTLAEQEACENREKALRALAELDNVRRRAAQDVENAHRYGASKLLTYLIPVLDSLEQAMQLAEKDKAMYEGLELTMKLFLDVLDKQGVVQLDPLGETFNPQEHEAMSIQEIPGAAPNSIITVFQKGYRLHDRIIRPARVIVAKSKPVDENI